MGEEEIECGTNYYISCQKQSPYHASCPLHTSKECVLSYNNLIEKNEGEKIILCIRHKPDEKEQVYMGYLFITNYARCLQMCIKYRSGVHQKNNVFHVYSYVRNLDFWIPLADVSKLKLLTEKVHIIGMAKKEERFDVLDIAFADTIYKMLEDMKPK